MIIDHIEVVPISVPVIDHLRIRDSYGWKTNSYYNIIILYDKEGRKGYGEATFTNVWSGETQVGSKDVIENVLFPAIKGMKVFDIEMILQKMDSALFGHPSTKAALEMAVYDLYTKSLNIPLYQLIGGKMRDDLVIKFSISAGNLKDVIRKVEYVIDQGIQTVKIKVGTSFNEDVERVKTVHREFGDKLRIAIDANNALTVNNAKRMIDALTDINLLFFEQPVAREDVYGMLELKNYSSIPIVIDEGVFTEEQALRSIKMDASDIYAVYPGKNGGITKTKRILDIVKVAQKEALLGSNLELGIASAAMIHLGISSPAISNKDYPSDIIGPLYHQDDIVKNPIVYKNGKISALEQPGLGIELDYEKVKYFTL